MRNPAYKKRLADSWWYKGSFIAAGYILARNISDQWVIDAVVDAWGLLPDTANFFVENAIAIVALGGFYLKFKQYKDQKKKQNE